MISYNEEKKWWDLEQATDKEMEVILHSGQLMLTMILGARLLEGVGRSPASEPVDDAISKLN